MDPASKRPIMGHGLSGHLDPLLAAEQVCDRAAEGLGGRPVDLAFLFISAQHVEHARRITDAVRGRLTPKVLVGVSGESVIGGRSELEGVAGMSLLAARLPGVLIEPFCADDLFPYEDSKAGLRALGAGMGAGEDLRATFVFIDPFSVPLVRLLPALNKARRIGAGGGPAGSIFGGVASASTVAGGNALILDGRVMDAGLVGVSLRGPVRVDPVLSQGCRPIGPNFVVTKAKKNLVLELGGRKALEVVQEVAAELDEDERKQLGQGLFLGRVINEYKDRFGRDDYLIRNVVGANEQTGGVAVGDFIRVGQTVRLHLRDAATADEDLAMLLDAQKLRDPPAGALLITCNGRGRRLFDRPNHDAEAVTRAFSRPAAGEQRARGGEEIDATGAGPVPLAGFFAAGEIGPVGEESFLHGNTACVAVFRGEMGG